MIHSLHLYSLDSGQTKITFLSPKGSFSKKVPLVEELILKAAGLSAMSLESSSNKQVYIPGNSRQTQISNNRAFDSGIVTAF